ncbi:Ankyrin-2, partial [Fragariocoptes setiger]
IFIITAVITEDIMDKMTDKTTQDCKLQRDLADTISRLGPLDDIRILLACGARVNEPVTQGLMPIHYAAYQKYDEAVRLLLLRGCDINAMDDNGYTPLHLCAERGYYDLLEMLIKNGAKVRFTDIQRPAGASIADEPLSLAIKRGHLECAELLLKHGADPNARYFLGSEINLVSILKISAIELLLRYGANPDSRDRSGLTPLMKAARHPQGYATVKLLIDYGADVNDIAGERHDYRTVLHHSIFSGNIGLIRLLLYSGARYPNFCFDKPSPLDIAIIGGRPDIARLLIEFGANVNSGANTTIGLPLHTALTQRVDNKREIVKLLLDSGANVNSITVSESRNLGPPLLDYLHSFNARELRRRSSSNPAQSFNHSNNNCNTDNYNDELDIEIIRTLLQYGARVIFKNPSSDPLGLIKELERVANGLTNLLVHLLLDAAEKIDWSELSQSERLWPMVSHLCCIMHPDI